MKQYPAANHLGTFDTPEEAAQAYLQHWQTDHPEALKNQSNGMAFLINN
jgi:hypothetical protein